LLTTFGSRKRLSAATVEEIAAVPGIGPRTAQAVVDALAGRDRPAPAVNTATGEIIDDDDAGTDDAASRETRS
jgi:excinuclease ABC subunit C